MSSETKTEGQEAQRLLNVAVPILLLAATLAAYLPAMDGAFIWDDDAHVTKPELRSLEGLGRIWFDVGATQQYYPLLHTAFWVEYQLWGDDPRGYHCVNIFLHAAAASLLFFVLRRLEIPGAAVAAAIFAMHPVNVESVAWISELKNTLSAVFYFSAALVYLEFDEKRKPSLYYGALGVFILGLLSKTVTATLPAALLVVFWWKRGRLRRSDWLPLIPWLVVGAVAGFFTAWVERELIGARGEEFVLGPAQRTVIAGHAVWFYFGKIFWPAHLIFSYPRWQINVRDWRQWVYPASAAAVVGGLWAVRGRGRGPLAAALFFIGTLVPVLGFFNVYPYVFSFVADHFQYLACVGIISAFSAGITLMVRRTPIAVRALPWVVPAVLAVLTYRQSQIYSDPQTLYEATLRENPASWLVHNNLGNVYGKADRLSDAMNQFHEALALKPDFGEAHGNLAMALALDGQSDEAIREYRLAIQDHSPDRDAHHNLGILLAQTGQYSDAAGEFQQAIADTPEDASDYLNLVKVYSRLGREELARDTAIKGVAAAHALGQTEVEGELKKRLLSSP